MRADGATRAIAVRIASPRNNSFTSRAYSKIRAESRAELSDCVPKYMPTAPPVSKECSCADRKPK
jgi:hypothetical protein